MQRKKNAAILIFTIDKLNRRFQRYIGHAEPPKRVRNGEIVGGTKKLPGGINICQLGNALPYRFGGTTTGFQD